MNKQIETTSRLIGTIYEGPLENPSWSSLLAGLQSALNADGAALLLADQSPHGPGKLFMQGFEELQPTAIDNPYTVNFYRLDPFVNLPLGEVRSLDQHVGTKRLLASEFYRLHLQPSGIRHILGVDTVSPCGCARLRIIRRKHGQAFSKSQHDVLQLIEPHLRRALRIDHTLAGLASTTALLTQSADQHAVASIIITADLEIIQSNEAAQRLLSANQGMSKLRDATGTDKLVITDRGAAAALRDQIAQLQDICATQAGVLPGAVSIPRADGSAALAGIVKPLIPGSDDGSDTPGFTLFISDPESSLLASQEALRKLFGLTRAEAGLALRIADGASLEYASEQLDISKHTGRAHLRAIFAKAGVKQQSQLVSLVLKTLANMT